MVDFIGRPLQLEGLAGGAQHARRAQQQQQVAAAAQRQQEQAAVDPDAPPEAGEQPLGMAEQLPLLNQQVRQVGCWRCSGAGWGAAAALNILRRVRRSWPAAPAACCRWTWSGGSRSMSRS